MNRGVVLALALQACATPEERLKAYIKDVNQAALKSKGPRAITNVSTIAPAGTCPSQVKSYNGNICCREVKSVKRPATVDEVMAEVTATPGPLRVVGRMHSGNPQLCTDGTAISTENLSRYKQLEHRNGHEIVMVDAGVTLRDLNRFLYEENRSLGYTVLGFRGITVGGALATAAHGSSLKHPSVISSLLEYVEWVGPDGVRHELWKPAEGSEASETFRAFGAHMGMLGVVTRVGLRVERKFDLDVKVEFDQEKLLFQKGVAQLAGACDWAQIIWFPRANRIVRMCGNPTDEEPQPGAHTEILDPKSSDLALSLFRDLMETTIQNGAPLCSIEGERYRAMKRNPPLVRECGCTRKHTCRARGPSHLMMASELTPKNADVPQVDFEIAVPMSEAEGALALIHEFANRKLICLPLFGVFLRFSKHDDSSLIGHSQVPGDVLYIEFVVYKPEKPDPAYWAPYRELARRLLSSHQGLAHWAKNEPDLFVAEQTTNPAYAARLARFRAVAARLDPTGRFASDFTKRVGLSP